MTRLLLTAASAVALSVGFGSAEAQTVRMDLQGGYGSNVGVLGPAQLHLVDTINNISGGSIRVRFHEPNSFVPNLQSLDAVANNSLDAAWTSPGYWTGKDIAFALVGAVPFGPRAAEYVAWMKFGGGRELWDELYGSYGVIAIPCGIIPPESSGWFRQPVEGVEDLEGIKMRFYGLGAEVMEKLGVATQLIGGGEIFQALQLGTIDATEFSMPSMDLTYGFYQVATHNYFPGWHQQSTLNDLLISQAKWDEMSDAQKAMWETACDANMMWQVAYGEAQQGPAMKELQEKGVTFHTWSDEMLGLFEEKWNEVVAEKRAESEMFDRMWVSLSEFREAYRPWKEMGYLQ